MSIKEYSYLLIAMVLVGVGAGVGEYYYHQHEAKVDLQQADQHGAKAEVEAIQWQADHSTTVADDAQDKAKDQTIAALKAELAVLQKPLPPLPGVPAVTPPPETPVEHVQGQIIAAEDDRLALAQKQIDDRDKELVDAHAQVKELQLEVGSLRATLAAIPKPRPWGAGPVYGTNGTMGAGVVRTFGTVEFGMDVVQQNIGGGQKAVQVVGRAILRW